MKKSLVIIGVVVLVLALGVYIVLQFFLGSIVTAGVNQAGPRVTQTKVTLQSAHISPFSGQGTLNGLVIGNPPGWSDRPAFQLGTVHVDVQPASLMSDHVVVNELTIDAPVCNYETKLVASNLTDLAKNIEQSLGGAPAANEPAAKSNKRIEVKHLLVRNGQVSLGVGGTAAATTITVPDIELRDLGTAEGGLPPNELAVRILKGVTPTIVAAASQNVDKLGASLGGKTGETIQKAGALLQGLLGTKPADTASPPAGTNKRP